MVPVFVPPRGDGASQAAIEGFNGLWQAKVWARFQHPSLEALQASVGPHVAAHRQACGRARIEAAPGRARPASTRGWRLDLQAHPQGRLRCSWQRRSNGQGEVQLLGRAFSPWIRCGSIAWSVPMLILKGGRIRFCTLRRRGPDQQPMVKETRYLLPHRPFSE